MDEFRKQPVIDASAWRGSDLAHDRGWEFVLSDGHREELVTALGEIKRGQLNVAEVNADNFRLPKLAQTLRAVSRELRDGRGFALLRRFPVENFTFDELEIMYWGLCCHIGTGVTQNSDSGFIHYVTDGALRPNQGTRGVGFPAETPLHVDLTDVASLLCVRQAPDDPPSRVGSSTTLFNNILEHHPEYLPRLFSGYEWDRMGEHGDGESATSGYLVPLFSEAGGFISCQYNRNWMVSVMARRGCPVSEIDVEIFDYIDKLARENCFEFPFHTGDIQFCNNYTVMHGRAAHTSVEEEERKRILMRIWLEVENFRAFKDEAIVRRGIGHHGALGWTPNDITAGRHKLPRPRRSDGALVCS